MLPGPTYFNRPYIFQIGINDVTQAISLDDDFLSTHIAGFVGVLNVIGCVL